MANTAENETMEIVLTVILVAVIGIIAAVAGMTLYKAPVKGAPEAPVAAPTTSGAVVQTSSPTPTAPRPTNTAVPGKTQAATQVPAVTQPPAATLPAAQSGTNRTTGVAFVPDPSAVAPVIECVRNNGDGTYTAYFGYRNDLPTQVTIPVGRNNTFVQGSADRGQPTVFLPGIHFKAVTVVFQENEVTWKIGSKTTSAFTGSGACTVPPTVKFHSYPLMGDAPLQVTFSDDSAGSPVSWLWSFGNGETSTEENPSYLYLKPGTYTVALTVKNPYGGDTLTKTDCITVTG